MPGDDATWPWEPVLTIQVAAQAARWIVDFALAPHQGDYYLRLRTYKADAPDQAHVRLIGPYPDRLPALRAVPHLSRDATRDLVGAGCPPPPETEPGTLA